MLGRPLFERQGKQMALTHWGMWLRPKAKRLLQDAQQIEMGFYEQHLLSGELKLGASQTPAEHLVRISSVLLITTFLRCESRSAYKVPMLSLMVY